MKRQIKGGETTPNLLRESPTWGPAPSSPHSAGSSPRIKKGVMRLTLAVTAMTCIC